MNVLVTGGGGFIGSHLVEDQLKKGRRVRAFDLDLASLKDWEERPQLQKFQGDIRNSSLVRQALSGVDVVFHLASAHLSARTPKDEYWDINVRTVKELLRLCLLADVKRFIHCSSVGVHGDVTNPPANEDSRCQPDLTYEKTKLAGEQVVMRFYEESRLPISIVRPAWVYGSRCPRTAKLFRAIRKRRFPMVGDGQTLRHCLYIDDLIDAFERCATRDAAVGQTFIIGDERAVTIGQLVEEIAAVLGVPVPRIKVPLSIMKPLCAVSEAVFKIARKEPPFSKRSLKFFTNNTSFDISKAKTLLEFVPQVSLREGLPRTYDYLRLSRQIY